MLKALSAFALAPLAAAVVLPLAGCGYDHHHRDREVVVDRRAPVVEEREVIVEGDGPLPPPRVETVTVRPYPAAVWHPGHWERRPHRWVWVHGHWS